MSVGFKGIFSIQRTNDNYPGLNLGSGSHNSVTILGFNHDFASRPSDWTFQPSKEFRVGLQGLLGVEFGWNSDLFTQTLNYDKACGY
jgi:hypothetical protein